MTAPRPPVRLASALLLAVLLALAAPAAAQVTGRGTEFWACWPRSHLSLETSAEIIVMSDAPTTAQVDGAFAAGPSAVAPGSPWVVPIPSSLRMAAERTVLQAGFRIRSLDPAVPIAVTLRVPRQAEASDDTARLLPVAEMGTRYIVTSYPASLPGEPSLYTVVATQDATQVSTFVPCAGVADNVVLNAGQAYQVFCHWRDVPPDVSGAEVLADKPVAVFGGNSDAFVPTNYLSGDFVVEQMTPVASWGTEFYLTPLPKGPGAVIDAYDVVRVMPSAAGTVMVDSGGGPVPKALAGPGQPTDLTITTATQLVADVPVAVYQFATGIEMTDLGDPFMTEIPPVTHWGRGARSWIPPYYSLGNYLSIVTETAATASVRLDAAPVPRWTPLPGGTYSWALADVGLLPGERVVSGDAPLVVVAYGFNSQYLPDPGVGNTPGSHGTPAAHAVPPCAIVPQATVPSSSCAGATVRLRENGSTSTGCAELEFRWLQDGVEIPGCGFSPTGSCDVVFRSEASYSLEARCLSEPTCVAVVSQRVIDEPAPPVVITPDPAQICERGSLALEASAGFLLYAWNSDVPDPGVTPRTSAIPVLTVTPDVDTRYTVVAYDVRGCVSTSSVVVSVTPDPLPPPIGASLRVIKSGTVDTTLTWQDLPDPARDYEVVVLDCASRDWRVGCAGRAPDPPTIQASPLAEPAVAPGTQLVVHRGALDRGDLLFYKVRATSPCLGSPGPTCNGWPMQVPPCP